MQILEKPFKGSIILSVIFFLALLIFAYRERIGLATQGNTVKGKIENFGFSGYRLMVYIRFYANGKQYLGYVRAGKQLRTCYYLKGRPCIGDTCLVTYWKKNPNIIDYELIK